MGWVGQTVGFVWGTFSCAFFGCLLVGSFGSLLVVPCALSVVRLSLFIVPCSLFTVRSWFVVRCCGSQLLSHRWFIPLIYFFVNVWGCILTANWASIVNAIIISSSVGYAFSVLTLVINACLESPPPEAPLICLSDVCVRLLPSNFLVRTSLGWGLLIGGCLMALYMIVE